MLVTARKVYKENVVAYTASGIPLSESQYQKRIAEGIEQCKNGKSTTLEQLCRELGYNYEEI